MTGNKVVTFLVREQFYRVHSLMLVWSSLANPSDHSVLGEYLNAWDTAASMGECLYCSESDYLAKNGRQELVPSLQPLDIFRCSYFLVSSCMIS